MENIQVDARGRSCPEPVLMTKKALRNNPSVLEVIVDNTTARENVTRLARNSGYQVEVQSREDDETLILRK